MSLQGSSGIFSAKFFQIAEAHIEAHIIEQDMNFGFLRKVVRKLLKPPREICIGNGSWNYTAHRIKRFSREPRPKGRGMIGKGLRTLPKFGFELPGLERLGFRGFDERFR